MSDQAGPSDPQPEAFPLLPQDPPSVGGYWLDARLHAQPSGVSYLAHDDIGNPLVVVLLSEGAAGDAAARDRMAGMVNRLHIDQVVARGGQGQDTGRLARRYVHDNDAPVEPSEAPNAPWVALAHDGTTSSPRVAEEILTEVTMALLPQQGRAAGPDYRHYWIDRINPGRSRIWPLPWPGRHDRAGWVTILVSWILMLLLAALAVLIAILLFRNEPPQAPPPPVEQTGSPPPQSGSPPPDSSSPSPDSASPSPESGSPSPESGSPSPDSGSPSPSDSGSPSASESGSPTPSESGSPSPSEGSPSGSPSESAGGEPSPRSRL
ncbi:hypothetical protein [Enemella sp. A6]|uniref:hypothetical protein n=1 Tax=Enemella sp. A6 TaxID=3440152 RepID=UPI003EBC4FB6